MLHLQLSSEERRCAIVLIVATLCGCGARTGLEIDAYDASPAVEYQCDRELVISFVPTHRAQIALWVEEGEVPFTTIALTEATALRGIGNRRGALQMNSGFRWPYGRRENVLPAWAGSRLRSGAAPFRRVIFRNRASEGNASGAGSPDDGFRDTPDDYFCLSFVREYSTREYLDAVSCASRFHSDKGRYLTLDDVERGYFEPEETAPRVGRFRRLDAISAYPPRRDLVASPDDHPDVAQYASDALASMPELDAITIATPPGDVAATITYPVPELWPGGAEVRIALEINTEGDYNASYGPTQYPTPFEPRGAWDTWGSVWGYPYRGQPSVVFEAMVVLPPVDEPSAASVALASRPSRRGTLDASYRVVAIDGTITDDPRGAPGSGADRLRMQPDGIRMRVTARQRECRTVSR